MSEVTRDIHQIESKWQRRWQEMGLFKCDLEDPRPRFYCLTMYPYSGSSSAKSRNALK